MEAAPPKIFAPRRRAAVRSRARQLQRAEDAARFVLDDMVDDVIERLAFLRHEPRQALVIGDRTGRLGAHLASQGAEVATADPAPGSEDVALDEEQPYPRGGFDLIVSLAALDTVNDLPGALIHMRHALAPGGLALASFVGAGSLPHLRRALLAADGERPAARMHPMVDVRAAAQLIQRAGWADPVVDGYALTVSYASLDRLIEDLRAQGLTNVLAQAPPALTRNQLASARKAFLAEADEHGRVVETFELITLSGRRR